jgi:long-chain fatty acid transport protein
MLSPRVELAKTLPLTLLILALSVPPARAQIGPLITGAGPVNRSMAGAAVAAPLDAAGALYWNPATTTALPSSSLDFGLELLYPQTSLASSLPANSLGRGIPPIPLAGSSRGDDGIFPLPSIGLIYKPDESPFTLGLGLFPVAGFGVNYSASATNPILTPQPPSGLGLGSVFSELAVFQLAPTVAVKLSDRLSVGVGPTVDLATLRADPLFIAAPDSNGMYPPGTHSRITWGAGVQGGIYYVLDGGWQVGASVKSPQWFEDFHFQSADQLGRPRNIPFHVDLPMIASIGVGYAGFDRWLLAADFRYIDFASADGFRQSGFTSTGAVQGLGFRSVFALSLGAQYHLTDSVSLRLGYSYNQDPIENRQSSFNVASPTILEHTVYLGTSFRITNDFTLSLAYAHGFESSIAGPLETPFGGVPGSSVKNTTAVDTFLIGATVRFGGQCSE